MKHITSYWYRPAAETPFWLKPFSYLFRVISALRRFFYKVAFMFVFRPRAPVIVVGNINVGGTGKTPFVIWLANVLKEAGYHPGIVSRGYGGQASVWPQQVRGDSDPLIVGDEAVLIARNTGCPMAVGPKRRAAAKELLKHKKVDVIISDDGLQHYALARDIEFAIVDGERRFGNGYCLPAGPLREPISRLQKVDFIVCNGGEAQEGEFLMRLQMAAASKVADPAQKRTLESFKGKTVHAVAGIGNPQRFFNQLKDAGIETETREFPDHHSFNEEDLRFADGKPVLMTEKDAVKCERFAPDDFWYVGVEADIDNALAEKLLEVLEPYAKRYQRRRRKTDQPAGSMIDGTSPVAR